MSLPKEVVLVFCLFFSFFGFVCSCCCVFVLCFEFFFIFFVFFVLLGGGAFVFFVCLFFVFFCFFGLFFCDFLFFLFPESLRDDTVPYHPSGFPAVQSCPAWGLGNHVHPAYRISSCSFWRTVHLAIFLPCDWFLCNFGVLGRASGRFFGGLGGDFPIVFG